MLSVSGESDDHHLFTMYLAQLKTRSFYKKFLVIRPYQNLAIEIF